MSTNRGHAALRPADLHCLPPEEGQQESSYCAQAHNYVNESGLVQPARAEAVGQGDAERAHVGQLDQRRQVGGQVPALGDLGHDEGKLHPEATDGHPGAQAKQAGQHVCENRHGALMSHTNTRLSVKQRHYSYSLEFLHVITFHGSGEHFMLMTQLYYHKFMFRNKPTKYCLTASQLKLTLI